MATLALQDPKQIVTNHLAALRDYARRVLVEGVQLSEAEDSDRAERLKEFLAIGSSFKLTIREMAVLVLKELLAPRRACGCPTCIKRSSQRPTQ